METTVKQRLIDFLKYKRIGQKRFATECGLSAGYVNSIRKSIQPDTLHTISKIYPDLNTGWLITGNGNMINDIDIQYEIKKHTIIGSDRVNNLLNKISELSTENSLLKEPKPEYAKKDAEINKLLSIIDSQQTTINTLTQMLYEQNKKVGGVQEGVEAAAVG